MITKRCNGTAPSPDLPVYLKAEVRAYLTTIGARKGVPVSEVANDLLKREIAIIEAVK